MSYNFTIERVTDEVPDELRTSIDAVKKTAPPHEHDRIEASGQLIDFILGDIPAGKLVNVQAYGSETPSVGESTFFISITAKTIQRAGSADTPKAEPWDPSKGPLSITKRRAETAAAPAAASSTSSARAERRRAPTEDRETSAAEDLQRSTRT